MSLITLHNQNLDPVIWEDKEACDFKIDRQVDIWRVNIQAGLFSLKHFWSVLNRAEIERAGKYLREQDSKRFIVSRGALRNILSGYLNRQPEEIEFIIRASGKPFITTTNDQSLYFNLSDSGDWVVIAVAGSEIGIDVEFASDNFNYDDVLAHNFNEREVAYITSEDSLNRFFLLWTRKEAVLKATGIGLTDQLKMITVLDGLNTVNGEVLSTRINWQLGSFGIAKNYPATVSVSPDLKIHRFFNYHF